mmetsp:Transcript_20523/g.46568  ORF Transcript_20523/g.46568 Transcript_20523/m.46568 type:complete len:153 (-) Transcript_20523:95-553(-)
MFRCFFMLVSRSCLVSSHLALVFGFCVLDRIPPRSRFFFFAVLAILFNCSEPEAIGKALERIHDDSDLVHKLNDDGVLLGAYANRLAQIDPSWTLAESEAPQPFRNDLSKEIYWKDFVEIWIDKFNVRVVGGCCGITPEHIRYIRAEVDKRV